MIWFLYVLNESWKNNIFHSSPKKKKPVKLCMVDELFFIWIKFLDALALIIIVDQNFLNESLFFLIICRNVT